MAVSIDPQTALSAAGALLTGTSRMLLWSLTTAPVHVYRVVSVLATPLTISLSYVLRAVLFLLSPVFLVVGCFARTGGYLIDTAVRAKYLYEFFTMATLIGILAACLLHGTSTVVFLILGIDRESAKARKAKSLLAEAQIQAGRPKKSKGKNKATKAGYDYDEDDDAVMTPSSTESSSGGFEDLGLSSLRHQGDKPVLTPAMCEEIYRRSKSTRLSPIRPSRRFRTLLAQTIHEESSESDDASESEMRSR